MMYQRSRRAIRLAEWYVLAPREGTPMGGRVPGGAADPPSPTSLRLHEPDADALRSAPNPRFVIGVIDTGVFLENEKPHPFIARHLAADPTEDEIPDEGYLLGRYDGHGTFVAGLIHHEAPGATIHMQNALDRRNGVDESGRDNRVAAQIEALAN